MAAYERAEQDGVLSLDDGEVVWHWPNDGEVYSGWCNQLSNFR